MLAFLLSVLLGCAVNRTRQQIEAANFVIDGLIARAEYARAEEGARQTLVRAERELGPDHVLVALTLGNLARASVGARGAEAGLPPAQRALEIVERTHGPESRWVGWALALCGWIETSLGHYDVARRQLERSLEIAEQGRGNAALQTEALGGLATLYVELGDYERAAEYATAALTAARHSSGRGSVLVGERMLEVGVVYARLEFYEDARQVFEEALKILEAEVGRSHPAYGFGERRLAWVHRKRGELAQALWLATDALQVIERALGPKHPATGWSLMELAEITADRKEPDRAELLFARALVISDAVGLPALRWESNHAYARLLAKGGRRDAAILFGKRAVEAVQEARDRVRRADASLEINFLESKRELFEDLADWLVEAGRLDEAQLVLGILKRDEYREFTRGRTDEVAPEPSRVESDREREARDQYLHEVSRLAQLAQAVDALSTEELRAPGSLSEGERMALAEKQRELAESQQASRARLDAVMDAVRAQGRAEELGEKHLGGLRALRASLRRLGPGTVLLHFLVTDQQLHSIVTTEQVQLVRSSPVKSAELNRLIFELRKRLANPGALPYKESGDLWRVLFQPLRGALAELGARTLMVSLDGALRYVPIAALWDPERRRYLIEDYAIAIYPEAAPQSLERPPAKEWRVTALGVSDAVGGMPALHGAERELDAIVKLDETDRLGVLPGVVLLNSEFSATHLLESLHRGNPVMHVASHFVLRPGSDADSFLLLGNGEKLTLRQIRDGDFPLHTLDLITLSACETGVGSGGDGREIEGFASLAIHQGAASVLATLWPLDDETAALLMPRFYRAKTAGGLTKAAALRQAQLSLLHGDRPHPFYWAPFVLLGNWL